jgi:spore maturation protein CgeB
MRIVILGLSITSSWGNGHATTFRGLVRGLAGRGHDVLFLERDMPEPPWGRTELYGSLEELRERHRDDVEAADLLVVGSYVPDGPLVAEWALSTAGGATAFYDIDTPVTLAKLNRGDTEYLTPELIPRFDLYLSFTGGPTLDLLERRWGARSPRAFYCLVDPELYEPRELPARWDLGYLGTYGEDRQPALDRLLLQPAAADASLRCVVGGPRYPDTIRWPSNVERREHVPPAGHAEFYCAQRFTLNVTRADMRRSGWSPSVRLFEAAACGVPVISDRWAGLDRIFGDGEEILIADSPEDVLRFLRGDPETARAIGARARERVLREHTAERRVERLEELVSAMTPA